MFSESPLLPVVFSYIFLLSVGEEEEDAEFVTTKVVFHSCRERRVRHAGRAAGEELGRVG